MTRALGALNRHGERRRLVALAIFYALMVPAEIAYFETRGTAYGIVDLLSGLTWTAAGLVAWHKRPANPAGLLMVAYGVVWVVAGNRYLDGPDWAATVGWVFSGGTHSACAAVLLLVFPGTRVKAAFDRWLLGFIWLEVTVLYWAYLLFRDPASEPCDDCAEGPNALGIVPDADVAETVLNLWSTVSYFTAAIVLLRLGMRWRAASAVARRALAPVLLTGAVAILFLIVYVAGAISYVVWAPALCLIPLGFLAGVLRTRVTRSTVGELVVELAEMPAPDRLRQALARALGDPTLELGFWSQDLGTYVTADGQTLELPESDPRRDVTQIDYGGQRQAVLVHDPALREDEGLLEAVEAAARLALQNARLQAEVMAQLEEVRRSRQRIVEAGDAQRRRIERDLHDGAQQRLVSLALSLRILQSELGNAADPKVEALLDQAGAEAEGAISELRELARGIHPAVLVDSGLAPALEGLARRSPVPVEVRELPATRLPAAVEVAAYFVCSECIVNAARHAHASAMSIVAREDHDSLVVEVSDDGVGGAHFGAGSGLAGLRDRVEALGGTLVVVSPPGRGTRITARLAIARDSSAVT